MKTIADFITHLRLKRDDEAVLIGHIKDCHVSASGPSLDDKCTDKFRRYLKSRPPPPDMSWHGSIKLEDALNKGFTSKQAYKIGIPSIGIVAVLVANVTFIAWATPPGGPSPFWLGCEYSMFTAFLIVNGIAFVLAVASAVVVTAFPLVLSRTPHQAACWGGILLMMSMLAFIVAFLLAGFVTIGYKAPSPSCSTLQCIEGGIACNFQVTPVAYDDAGDAHVTVFQMDGNVAALNSISNSSSSAVCVTYNRSMSHGPTSSTLYPWVPPPSLSANGGDSPEAAEAVTQLLIDPIIQLQTVCMDATNFPTAIDSSLTENSLDVHVSYDIVDLADFVRTNGPIFDLLPNSSFVNLFPYTSNYFCMSNETEETMNFNVLCDSASQSEKGNLSVSTTGEYIRAVTASQSGATLFEGDLTAKQVSKAIEALGGIFAFIVLVIAIFLIKSKWF